MFPPQSTFGSSSTTEQSTSTKRFSGKVIIILRQETFSLTFLWALLVSAMSKMLISKDSFHIFKQLCTLEF
jgi:hypothetical protein